MPEGQYTGERCTYEYTDELGNTLLLTLDKTLGDLADNGLTLATATTGGDPPPKGFSPRRVYWKGTLGTRTVTKTLICGTTTAGLYASNVSQELTIDGAAGRTTGRKGEQISFINICPPPAP